MANSAAFSWDKVSRVLLVRLRSIGDTVLMTPCLRALKEWRPALEVDVLIEPLSAPILRAHPLVSNLYTLPQAHTGIGKLQARSRMVSALRARRYDIVFNLHGGTTATFFTRLTGAPVRVGYAAHRYQRLLTLRAPQPQLIWQKDRIHCVEQQLALLKYAGVPISAPPPAFARRRA